MGMFDNFTPTEISFNSPAYHYDDNSGDIIIGATNEHIFNVPFILSEFADMFDVIYRQGLTVTLTKHYDFRENNNIDDIKIKEFEDKDFTLVKVIVDENESRRFKNSVLECQAQMRIHMIDGTIFYSDVYDICVKSPLDNTNAV